MLKNSWFSAGHESYRNWSFLNFLQDQKDTQVQIQASAPITQSSLQAEALALLLAAKVTRILKVDQPTFLTDCLSLVKAVVTRSTTDDSVPRTIRTSLVDFFRTTKDLHAQVYHISKEINGIAHNVAHQVLT